jgi:hypothetical protein
LSCYAQTNDTTIYSMVDELPTFRGGDSLLANYVSKNFNFPGRARESGVVGGSTSVSFIVTSEGKIKNVKVTRGNTRAPSLDNEIVSVLEKMPDWIPGKHNGKEVNVLYLLDVFIAADKTVSIWDLSIINNMKAKADDAYNSGVKKSQEKDYKGAVTDFNETLKYNPKDIDALYNRGVMKLKLKDIEGACTDWNAIKELGKSDADELINKYCAK